MSDKPFNPEEASGANNYGGARALELNQVSLNGDAEAKEVEPGKFVRVGGYFRKALILEAAKDQKPEEQKLGNPISVVMLKIRRKLVERGQDGKIVRSTSEHNHKGEAVLLYEAGNNSKPIPGTAEDLRDRFDGLRTVQIVYSLLLNGTEEPELVKLMIKGSSLGSESKAEGVTDFYDYVSSFRKDADGNREHFYQFETVLNAVLEEGKKTYYTIDFKRGRKLSPEMYALALKHMEEVHNACTEVDTARVMKIAKGLTVETTVEGRTEDNFAVDMPKDDINPDDIPF